MTGRDGPIPTHQLLDCIDNSVLSKGIDTGEKYRLFQYSWACSPFGQRICDKHDAKNQNLGYSATRTNVSPNLALKRRKCYKLVHFQSCYN